MMKIAVFQADTKDKRISENLKRYRSFIDRLDEDTDLLIMPETFTKGFTIEEFFAEDMNGEGLGFMKQVAAERNMAVEGSLLIKEDGRYKNRHFFVTPDSVSYYDKRHLFCLSREPEVISRGENPVTVQYKGWKIKLQTCYDLRFPLWSRNRLGDKGEYDYDLLVYVASWTDVRISHWEKLLPARAIENQSYLVGVNRCGVDETGLNYKGASVVLDYNGNVLAAARDNTEEIVYAVIDKDKLDKYRKKFPVAKDWDSM